MLRSAQRYALVIHFCASTSLAEACSNRTVQLVASLIFWATNESESESEDCLHACCGEQLFEEFYSQCHVRIEAGGPSCNNCRRLQVDASDVEGFLRLCQGMSLGGGGGGGH